MQPTVAERQNVRLRKCKKLFYSRPQLDSEVPLLQTFLIRYLHLREMSCPLPLNIFLVWVSIFCDLPKGHKAAGSPRGSFVKIKKRFFFLRANLAPVREDGLESGAKTEFQLLLTYQLPLLCRAQLIQWCMALLSLCANPVCTTTVGPSNPIW